MDVNTAAALLRIDLTPETTVQHVKQAFVKLAREHPDKKNGADYERMDFDDIVTAKTVLSNYLALQHPVLVDVKVVIPPQELEVFVTLEQLFTGVAKYPITLDVKSRCVTCRGVGGIAVVCSCNSGTVEHQYWGNLAALMPNQMANGVPIYTYANTCAVCNGKSYYIANQCPDCKGKGILCRKEKHIIPIRAGTAEKEKLLRRYGESLFKFVIRSKEHHCYIRDGPNLIYKAHEHQSGIHVLLSQALRGFEFTVPLISGETVLLQCAKAIAPGRRFVLKGAGLPHSDAPQIRGDVTFDFHVLFPMEIDGPVNRSAIQIFPEETKKEMCVLQ